MNLNINPYILLGLINMKLRDYYKNLEDLVEVENIDIDLLISKLDSIGYIYNKETNQFISKDA